MSMSELFTSGPGGTVRPPAQCTCARDRTTATIDATLGCPGTWYERDDGRWAHAWPRRRQVRHRRTATETTTRGNRT